MTEQKVMLTENLSYTQYLVQTATSAFYSKLKNHGSLLKLSELSDRPEPIKLVSAMRESMQYPSLNMSHQLLEDVLLSDATESMEQAAKQWLNEVYVLLSLNIQTQPKLSIWSKFGRFLKGDTK
jgi:hypothetical protein